MCGLRRNSTSFWWLSFSSSFMSAAAASFFIPCSSMISILCSRSLALHRGDVMWKGVCLPAVRIFGNTYSEPVASSLGSNLRVVPKWASIPWWVGLGQAVKWARGAPEAAGADDDSHPLPEAAMACRGLYGAWSWATEGGAPPELQGGGGAVGVEAIGAQRLHFALRVLSAEGRLWGASPVMLDLPIPLEFYSPWKEREIKKAQGNRLDILRPEVFRAAPNKGPLPCGHRETDRVLFQAYESMVNVANNAK
eukprot:CAMPEP_0172589494 /NCGR_PEP_ID=MMETSP1068-20121228/8204_1 /TAXON_ID=35684 /ORGANISM="Pseudopedinella elastica, Strain CCMP716" /LENGTH=250 /DNA_ID=CAMNT_0013385103 /DNA_START=748 /DNA_END=1496 /DNA_ORIENTATION=+